MKKHDVKYFRMNGPTDYPSLFQTDPKLTQGYAMSDGCKSDFVEAIIFRKKREIVGEIFPPPLEIRF